MVARSENHGDETLSVVSTESSKSKSKKKKSNELSQMVSVSEFLSFYPSLRIKIILSLGVCAAFVNGLSFPFLAYAFSNTMSDLGSTAIDMNEIAGIAYLFLGIGSVAFVAALIQNLCFDASADRASRNFRQRWFKALLRQDAAYFDTHEVGGIASSIGANTKKIRTGLGAKLGEGIQFGTTAVGGLVYAFYSSWKVTLLLLAILPIVAMTGVAVMKINQSKSAKAAKSYETASGIVYSTVSSIRTVLSLNAVEEMIRRYVDATQEAYDSGVSSLLEEGFANGSMLGSFIALYGTLTLFGSYLIYTNVQSSGCDPAGGVPGVTECTSSGPKVFGALLGAAFAGQGASQIGNVLELVVDARVAMYPGLKVMNRVVGSTVEEETISVKLSVDEKNSVEEKFDSQESDGVEEGTKQEKLILPPYKIDSSSTEGLKPDNIKGEISFENVQFAYPTRPGNAIFKNFNLNIKAGTTIALVGPSGSGKSTTVSLIERFYDPNHGTVTLDGIDLTKINVTHLRSLIGYVGQEPTLFATSIAGNIRYGKPNATQEEIEEAARKANAHDFIMSFPDRYDTQVGDKGSQLSGGQKQRIAIARVLVSNPKILLFDEATSALDSESELVVQDALDKMLQDEKRTTIIIAHRLSTIRNVDVIAVVSSGEVVEQGSHDDLMELPNGHYKNLVEKQNSAPSRTSSTSDLRQSALADSLHELQPDEIKLSFPSESVSSEIITFKNVTFSYPTRPKKLIMKNFNLAVNYGETLALVGPSGGGKSTVISLIERFYDPNEGMLTFDGNDLRTLNVSSLRNQIGLVAQEPPLFNMSIAENIRLGWSEATDEDITRAAKMANAYDFIMQFPEGFGTQVGEKGLQLSGGQKQRVAIARAIVKNPRVLLLDEATSALDSDSERIVQEALDNIINSIETTTIVIAHRLSTIRNANRIAFISKGEVAEIGTYDELMEKDNGRFRRLVKANRRCSTLDLQAVKDSSVFEDKDSDKNEDEMKGNQLEEEDGKVFFDKPYARRLAIPDVKFIFFGVVGSMFAGMVFPAWGIMFAQMIKVLFYPVLPCDNNGKIPFGHSSCQLYFDSAADHMRTKSYELGGYWALILFGCVFGNVLGYWGMGMANERLNKRVRDKAYKALVRQEISFFDKRSVGIISSQLQDDVTQIQSFCGNPVSELAVALCSVVCGLTVSFVTMWPFAVVALGTVPIMAFAASLDMKRFLGSDLGGNAQDELESPGGIVVETLLNIRTVAALTLEKARYQNYVDAIEKYEPKNNWASFKAGVTGGLSVLIQQYTNALLFYWGGYLLYKYPNTYDFEKFLTSMFSLLFSLFGLGAAFQGVSDKNKAMESAGRIFYLLKRKSAIDPLSDEGKKL